MSNILSDIVDEIQIKPNRFNLMIKWIISISITLITVAFALGQIKTGYANRLSKFDTAINNNTIATIELKQEMTNGFNSVNARIDNVYVDGYRAFTNFEDYNRKQLGLIIEYGNSNKDLLKGMLELNSMQNQKNVQYNLKQQAKKDYSIAIKPIEAKNNNYINLTQTIPQGTTDTIFYLIGANKEYINKIDRNKYRVGQMVENIKYPGLYDVSYTVK